MTVAIGRWINGISINGPEYVLDGPEGEVMLFESEDAARDFLVKEAGADPDELQQDLDAGAIFFELEEDIV